MFVLAVVIALICIIATAVTGNPVFAVVELLLLAAVIALVFVFFDITISKKQKMLNRVSSNLNFWGSRETNNFPLPVVLCQRDGSIEWFNSLFEEQVAGTNSAAYAELSETLRTMGTDAIVDSASGVTIECDGRYFNVFSHRAKRGTEEYVVMYFVDNTKYRSIADEFVRTRPAMVIMTIDNMAEIQQDYRESDCAAIRNAIEKKIEDWLSGYPCFISKVSDSKFCIVAEKQDADNMAGRKFDILDAVRGYTYDKGKFVGATLSIGVGNGSDLKECEDNAKLALDMALGRGGDQAVVRTKDNYEFFGGISKSVESTNKVKSRIVASALTELIKGCDSVFVMGHRFPDFDAVGAALGISYIARSFEKDAYIVTDEGKSMAKPLIARIKAEGLGETVLSAAEARERIIQGKKNLLVIVDTHITGFVEDRELLDRAKMVVVVDHHRKAVDYIKDSVIFFHDPSASSTSEMVTELIEYIPDIKSMDNLTADALMAGIVLDTKNFILRSTPRTFEAAAFLKSQNADTIRVKKLFSNEIENHYSRNRIISGAKKYRNCAIAVADEENADIRMISSQAADELLNISGVDASFVIFRLNDTVCVSARSYGAVNVQVLMEQLGGGGHQTMAAAQVKNSAIEEVTAKVMHSIENYREGNKQKEVQ